MKILVPVDGSFASANAAKKAVELAKKDGSFVKFIHVISYSDTQKYQRGERLWRQVNGSIISGKAMSEQGDEVANKLKEESFDLMESLASALDLGETPIEKETLVGEPYEKILETAKNEKFDLIVMGNRGFSKIKRFFVGSVAQRVIAEASCPVLVIHTDAED